MLELVESHHPDYSRLTAEAMSRLGIEYHVRYWAEDNKRGRSSGRLLLFDPAESTFRSHGPSTRRDDLPDP
jgi:hypothetical protein